MSTAPAQQTGLAGNFDGRGTPTEILQMIHHRMPYASSWDSERVLMGIPMGISFNKIPILRDSSKIYLLVYRVYHSTRNSFGTFDVRLCLPVVLCQVNMVITY